MPWPTSKPGKLIGLPYQGTHTLGNWQSDNAVDISVPIGTPLLAVEDAKVTKIVRHPQDGGRFAGDQITLQGASGNSYFYTHASSVAVAVGQQVKGGQMIGKSGSANGVAHLHFGVEKGDPRTVIDASSKSFGDKVLSGAISGAKGALGVTPLAPLVTGGAAKDAASGVVGDAATAGVKAGFDLLWGAIGEDAATAGLYVLLVGGGVFLFVIGAARATGVKPSSAVQAAVTVIPQARMARAAGALA